MAVRVLVVDDAAFMRMMVKDILSQRPKDAVNKNNPIIFIFLGFIYASMAPTKIQITSR